MPDDLSADIAFVQRLAAAQTILNVCAQVTGMGFIAIARVTGDRWVAASVLDRIASGLEPGGELAVDTTICGKIRDSRHPVVIENVAQDLAWCGHDAPLRYGFQSYLSVPIVLSDGTFFGTLCAIDPSPRRIDTPETIGTFTLFADLLAFHIDALRRAEASEALLARERGEAALRERFIAVLGHDLRNPLAAIGAGARLLGREALSDEGRRVLGLMTGSVERMTDLVDDVLDFARGRLAGGIPIDLRDDAPLASHLGQIVEELRSLQPHRAIETDFAALGPVRADPRRIGQMVSNLVANALMHGAEGEPIRVAASTADGTLTVTISNGGDPIPDHVLSDLFEPFKRGSDPHREEGLGLGLYIASQIARSHGGRLAAVSEAGATRLTFTMPLPLLAAQATEDAA